MLFSEENVKANIRNRDGKRVFYLQNGDSLTPSARDFLQRERIEILPASLAKPEEYRLENGAVLPEKPEHYTHLRGNILVPKTHPVIAFRGAMDCLQAELLLAQLPGRGFHLDTPAGRLVARMDGNARLLRESAAQGIRIEWVLHFFPAETGGAP